MTCVHGQSASAAAGDLELLQLLPGVRGLEQLAERQEGQISWMIARHLKKNISVTSHSMTASSVHTHT